MSSGTEKSTHNKKQINPSGISYQPMTYETSAGGAVINKARVVVVFQNLTKTWCLPKGHIENGESPEEAARREIFEETSIKELNLVQKLGEYCRGSKKSPKIKKRIIMFLFTTKQEYLKPIGSESLLAKWIQIDKVANLLGYEEDRQFFLKTKDYLMVKNRLTTDRIAL